ncbi:MAG TPA: membrane protein insertase YidC [Bacteroidales bacterium]|nr:membrane protein insertase YidC [Bacteroidales bacterium]
MDRNTIIGLLLIVGVVITFGIINQPSKEELERKRRIADSIELVRLEDAKKQQQLDTTKVAASVQSSAAISDSAKQQLVEGRYGVFAAAAKDTNRFITVENEVFKIKFSTKGGRPYSVELKKFNRYDSTSVVLFNGDTTVFGFSFFAQNRDIYTNDLVFTPQVNKDHILVQGKNETVSFRLNAGTDSYIEYVYTIAPDNYMVQLAVNFKNMDKVIDANRAPELNWKMDMLRQEKGIKNENNNTFIQYMHFDNEDESFSAAKATEDKDVPTKLKWVAFKQQFFSSVLIADNGFDNGSIHSVKYPETEQKYLKNYATTLGINYQNKGDYSLPLHFYFGPNKYNLLKKYDMGLENLVFIGKNIVKFINKNVILLVFNWLNSFISNYGLIILLLTLIIKFALFPLTFKSYLSQAKMRLLKPQIDEINQKIPKEKAMERQQATMALYKKAGVSPLGGCLPMLLQFPILIAMFRLFPTSIELRHQSFLWAEDLSTYDSILNLPFTIPFYGDHVSLFTILMTITTILSMKMTQSSTDYSAMPGMKTMMYIMPVMFLFILNSFSAGLTYYYFLANVITIGQNEIFRRMINEKKLLAQIHANKAKPVKKSGFQARLEKMAKERGYKMPKK